MESWAQQHLDLRPNGLVEQCDGSWPADGKHFRLINPSVSYAFRDNPGISKRIIESRFPEFDKAYLWLCLRDPTIPDLLFCVLRNAQRIPRSKSCIPEFGSDQFLQDEDTLPPRKPIAQFRPFDVDPCLFRSLF